MNIFLFLFSTFNFEPFFNLTQELDISWKHNHITYYELKDGVIVDVEVKSFTSFQDYLSQSALKVWYTEDFRGDKKTSDNEKGLVPVIDLPIKFPAPVAGIIGQGGKLDVSGSQRIEFEGIKTKNFDLKTNEYSDESWFPQLGMEQQLRVNLKGTIGEKINVFIDHDSEREFDLDNTIKLEYEGDEDEIVQSVKAGNIGLSLPGIKLIGGATSHKGLFGIKTEAKIGPVNITAVASKEEAENQSREWKGGGISEREITIDDRNFTRARFFLLAPPEYVHSLTNPHDIYSGDPSLLPKQIDTFHLYLDEDGSSYEGNERDGNTFDIPNRCHTIPDSVDTTTNGYFVEKFENDFYSINETGITYITATGDTLKFPTLKLNYGLSDGDLLAARWTYVNNNENIITVGKALEDSLKDLQIIKRLRTKGTTDTSYVSWWYELKNIYSIGGADISKIKIRVFKYNYGGGEDIEFPDDVNKTYRELLGLYTSSGLLKEGVLDTIVGTITFPFTYPFLMNSSNMEPDSIYNVPKFSSDIRPKYYIWVQYEGVKTEYSLGMLNIIEGSEVVKIDGETLEKNKDYTIDYDWGTIKFITPKAEDSNAKIEVDFQYVPIFQPTSKSLIGIQGESKIGEFGQISSAFLYYSTSSSDFRPRLGTEPRKIVLGEVVANLSTKPEFLTRLVNGLPLIETDAPSSLSLQGNIGFSSPNPNTRGEVYLDDMEGIKSSTSLGISRGNWHYGSVPIGKQIDEFAQIQWYNPKDGILSSELYPNLPENKKTEKKTILKLAFPSQDDWRYPLVDSTCWTSLLTCVSTRGMDFSEDEYLEVWVRGDKGTLHIDIGTDISEDHIRRDGNGIVHAPNDTLDTEDKDNADGLGPTEDTGLDGIDDGFDNNGNKKPDGTAVGDDGNDNYGYDNVNNPNDYSKINGTENNGILDEEDLDMNKLLNVQSNYFPFKIDLESNNALIEHANGWKLFRIPINEHEIPEGTSQWECIKYARIWIEGLSEGDGIEIATLDIVGHKWKHAGSDSVKISVKNTDENPDEYVSPPIELEKDPYGRTEREQSLVLNYNGLLDDEGRCYTVYTRARNLIQYRSLKIYIRNAPWSQGSKAKFFARIGGDELNYYEYRCDIPNLWEEVEIDLEKIAQLKLQVPDSVNKDMSISGDSIRIFGDSVRILGNPSFTNVGRIEFGVINEDSISSVSGEIWINELRLTDIRRDKGVAGNISTNIQLADLGNVSLSYTANDPYFKSLGAFASSQSDIAVNSNRAIGLQTNVSLNKFMPSSWGMAIPLNLSISKDKSIPNYQTGSDILLIESQSISQTSNNLKRNCGIGFSKSGSKNPFLKYTIDNISSRLSYGDNSSFAYTKIDSSKSYVGSISYGLRPPLPPIKIKNFELKYYPDQINLSTNYSYSLSRSYQMAIIADTTNTTNTLADTSYKCTDPAPALRPLSKSGSFSYVPINPLKFDYSTSMTNDLSIEGGSTRFDKKKNRFDTEIGRTENASVSFSPSFGFISPSVDYSTKYNEDNRKTLDTLREVSNSNNVSFGLPVDISKTLGFFTRIRDESRDSLASMGSPHWVLMMMDKLFQKFYIPKLSHSISRSSRFYKVIDKPCYKYKFGIWNEPTQFYKDPNNGFAITKSYGINSVGLNIGNISISGGATHSISKSVMENERKNPCSERTEFPKLSLNISRLEKLIFLRNLFSSFSTSCDYTVSWENSGYEGEDFYMLGRKIYYGFAIRPQWKRGISTGLSATFSNGKDETIGDTRSISYDKNANYSLQGSYTFRAPKGVKIPFLTHIKWTGNLDVSLTTTYSSNSKEDIANDKLLQDSKSLSMTPQAKYNFSSSITGGMNFSYIRHWDHIGTGNTRNVSLSFFAEFAF